MKIVITNAELRIGWIISDLYFWMRFTILQAVVQNFNVVSLGSFCHLIKDPKVRKSIVESITGVWN